MKSLSAEAELARRLKGLAGGKARPPRDLASRFTARLSEVAARPDAVPIRLCGGKIEARAGGTLLAAAMKSGIRMMHACGAQTLCATCRVKVTEGAENLTPMSFKEKLSRRGVDAFLLRDRWNIMYLTGYWHTSTERPQATYMNKDDADPWFLYPGLDRDSVSSWWFGGGWQYFDVKEAEGAFPNLGTYAEGKTVDLFQLLLEGIKKHGVQGNKIGLDGEFYPQEAARAKEILPGIEWVRIGS